MTTEELSDKLAEARDLRMLLEANRDTIPWSPEERADLEAQIVELVDIEARFERLLGVEPVSA